MPLPLERAYDYAVPADLVPFVAPGAFVRVPLGRVERVGVVWGAGEGDVEPARLKPVTAVLETPPMTGPLRQLVDWTADYTLTNRGSVLRMAMSVPGALEPPAVRTAYRLAQGEAPRMTAARERVVALLQKGPPRTASEIAREAGVSAGVVRGLAGLGAIEAGRDAGGRELRPSRYASRAGPDLSRAQGAAAEALRQAVSAQAFSVTVLDGVTGSGKTEVYFEAISAALDRDRQALVMLPEIALSAQWLARFRARFGVPILRSGTPSSARGGGARPGAPSPRRRAQVVVGARSSLWLPFRTLGLIVVDEEHDAAFKQEDGVVYHARDMAVVRARLEGCPIALVSATPSLESAVNVENGRYGCKSACRIVTAAHSCRRSRRSTCARRRRRAAPGSRRPCVPPSPRPSKAGEQALLFLNRRGYAPLTLCRACGHRFHCPNCSAWLVEHRFAGTLECHHCGFQRRQPETCPACDAEGSFAACGPGVERLAEEVDEAFPGARWAVLTSDTVRGPSQVQDLVDAIVRPRGRRADRHADGGQGAPLPPAHPGGRGGRRPGPRGRRHARRREDVSATSPGGRSRRARRASQAGSCCRPTPPSTR